MPSLPPVDFVDPFTLQPIVCKAEVLVLLWPHSMNRRRHGPFTREHLSSRRHLFVFQ